MDKVTINDIARMANVSSAAVSYVINNREGVSKKTRMKVQRIIQKTGYKPNISSRKLVMGKSFNIHIIIGSQFASFDNLFYNAAITRMAELCMHNGYNLVLSDMAVEFQESALMRSINQSDVDGVVFLQSGNTDATAYLQEEEIPYVILDAHRMLSNCNYVYCDYDEATYAATTYLLSKGHRKVGFVGMNAIADFFQSSLGGYKKALSDAGVTPIDAWVQSGTEDEDSIATYADALKKQALTGVVCATDVLAIRLMKRFRQIGIAVPRDISVCGIDNILLSQYCSPMLTTVEIDKRQMGEETIQLLLHMIDRKVPVSGQHVCIHATKIIERESVSDCSTARI